MPKVFPGGPTGNRLLNLLPSNEYEVLRLLLREVEILPRQILYEPCGEIGEIYFPINCVLSAVTVMRNGEAIEVATVGKEGVSGLPVFAQVAASPHRVFAQIGGSAWRADAQGLNRVFGQLPRFRETISTYQQAFMIQVSQSVACNGLHAIVQRCCRWLLMTHDRVEGDELALTHEFLSYMLGVRRSSVTEVLQSLQNQGNIRYSQGRIRILNRDGLEKLVCECYQHVRDEYQRLLA